MAQRFSSKYVQFGNYQDTSLYAASRSKEIQGVREELEREKLANRLARLQKKEQEEREAAEMAIRMEQRKLNRQQRQLEYNIKNQSAAMIQYCFRDYWFQKLIFLGKLFNDSAIKIQCFFRCWKARNEILYHFLLKYTEAAIKIQCAARARQSRQLANGIRTQQNEYATKIQSIIRRKSAYKILRTKREAKSATYIQSLARQYFAKEHVSQLRVLRARQRTEQRETQQMTQEDVNSRIYENMLREQKDMTLEEAYSIEAWAWAKQARAEKDGIPLLPWRQNTDSIREVMSEQKAIRRAKSIREVKQKQEEIEKNASRKKETLQRIEVMRQSMLQKAAEKAKSDQEKEKRMLERKKEQEALEAKKAQEMQARKLEEQRHRERRLREYRERKKQDEEKEQRLSEEMEKAEKHRKELYQKREALRLERIRSKGKEAIQAEAQRRLEEEKEKQLQEEERLLKIQVQQQKEEMDRIERRKRHEQRKILELQAAEEERVKLEEAAQLRKAELDAKAIEMRKKIQSSLRRRKTNDGSLRTTSSKSDRKSSSRKSKRPSSKKVKIVELGDTSKKSVSSGEITDESHKLPPIRPSTVPASPGSGQQQLSSARSNTSTKSAEKVTLAPLVPLVKDQHLGSARSSTSKSSVRVQSTTSVSESVDGEIFSSRSLGSEVMKNEYLDESQLDGEPSIGSGELSMMLSSRSYMSDDLGLSDSGSQSNQSSYLFRDGEDGATPRTMNTARSSLNDEENIALTRDLAARQIQLAYLKYSLSRNE